MSKIDLRQLVEELRYLQPRQKLYAVLKRELQKLGYWRNRPRGNPAKGYQAMLSKQERT